jgi:hypothetical protein
VNTALYEGGCISDYGINLNNKSHAPAWQVLNCRRFVSEPVSGSIIQSQRFYENFSGNLANIDKIGMSKVFGF